MSGRGLGFFAIVTVVASVGCSSSPTAPESARPDDPRTLQAAAHLDCETAEDIRALIDALEEDGTLNSGRATALRNKLDQAERHESAGRTEEAMEAYARLIAQVEEGVADGVLSEEGAADLLACAEDVLDGPDPVESFAYVTNIGSNNVSVIDIATNTVNATVAVGFFPNGVAITPDGDFAYVVNVLSDNVSVIETATNTVIATRGRRRFPGTCGNHTRRGLCLRDQR